MFGFCENGDVDSKRSLHIGSTNREIPDLILRKDNKDLFVIELKRYALSKTSDFEKQLLNYMAHTDLRLPLGVLVCEKLYAYYYDFASDKKFCIEIPFEKDNPNGEKFVELFCKENFDSEKAKGFIISKAEQNDDISAIQGKLNSDLVKQLVKAHFASDYDEETVEKALSEYSFSVSINSKDIVSNLGNNFSVSNSEWKKNNHIPSSQDEKNSVNLKGIRFSIYRSSSISVQDFVKETLRKLFTNGILSNAEINRLQDTDYSKQTFGIQYPLLQKEWKDCLDGTGKARYWGDSPTKKIGGFYVCSQWWKQSFTIYDTKIAEWLKTLEKEN